MHRVAADKFIVNITFGWEHAVAITTENDADKLVSHRFPQFSFTDNQYPQFYKYVIMDEGFRHHLWLASPGGAGRNRVLKIDEMLTYKMQYPSIEEQKRIYEFFDHIDRLITLHQRKCKIKKNVYTYAWEQYKLCDVVDRVTRKNTELQSTLPLTISAQYGLVDQITYFNNRVASSNVSNYYLVLNGEFAYNKSSSDGYPFGAVKRLDMYEMGVLSTLYIVFAIKEKDRISSDYLVTYYDTDNWHKGISEVAAEGARNHGLLNISAEDFLNTSHMKPVDTTEQQRIGDLFKKLDHLITLHQRKLDKLHNMKKSLLEKMFPKNGADVPEIRFSGFTYAWEQRKLGELADIVGGGTPSTSNDDYWDGNIDWYAPAEIADQIYVASSERKITQQGYDNSSAKMLPVGTVLFTSRAGIGKTAILRKEGCTNQGFQSIVPHINELDSYFIFSRSEEMKRYGETVGAGSTFVEVSGKQMANMELMMPTTMEEQVTIGSFFSNLDSLITLHQRKYDKLVAYKKSMLERMFPKKGETKPIIRFTGFSDDWEQRELRTAATFSKGSGYSKNDLKENGTPIILYGRLYTKYETVISEVDTFVDVQPNSVYSTGHEVIVPASGETAEDISRASFVAKSGILLGGDLNIIVPDDYINPVFLALTISNGNQQKELSKRAQGKSVVHIHNSDLENVVLLYPKYEEQEKIGEYFSKLDSLITLHQRKLEKLRQIKKSLLEKMFV